MKGLLKANFILGLIVGILFLGFGLYYLLTPVVMFANLGILPGGILAAAALVRLVFISIPASGSFFSGSRALDITAGILEVLFGVLFILNALLYIEFFYPLLAGLLAFLAVVRIWQGALVKKQFYAGIGSYLFVGIVLLLTAAALLLDLFLFKIGIQNEVIGAAALLYGIFVFASSFFRREKAGDPTETGEDEDGTETRIQRNAN